MQLSLICHERGSTRIFAALNPRARQSILSLDDSGPPAFPDTWMGSLDILIDGGSGFSPSTTLHDVGPCQGGDLYQYDAITM